MLNVEPQECFPGDWEQVLALRRSGSRRLTLIRRALLPALTVVAAFALLACDEDAPTSPATPTPNSTATASATPTPTGTVEDDDNARLTSDPLLDAIIRAVDERDVATLAGLVELQEVGCTFEQGVGGPPKCPEGASEGDLMRVFPASSCESYWTDTPVVELGYISQEARGLYAAVELKDGAGHSLIFHRDVNGQAWGAAIIVEDGRITSVAAGCGMPPEGLNSAGGEIIAGPWTGMIEPAPAQASTTGNGGVDATLAAVERFDLNALLIGALAAMQHLPPVACVEVVEGPGGVACDPKNGEVAGTEVPVFPLAYCEGALVRDPALPLAQFLNMVPELVAVVMAPAEPSRSELYPNGAYWIVYDLGAPDSRMGVRLHLTETGALTAIWYGCGVEPDRLLLDEQGEPLPVILEAAR